MFSKSRLLGLLGLLILAFLVFRPGDEQTDSSDQGGKSESAIDRQLRPREPAFADPDREFGIARRSDAIRGRGEPSRAAPAGAYPSAPYAGRAPMDTSGYRFRPLSEREKRRMEAAYAQDSGGYAMPYGPSGLYQAGPDAWPAPATPPAAPGYVEGYGYADEGRREPWEAGTWSPPLRDPWGRVYSFRPLEESDSAKTGRTAQDRAWETRDGVEGYGHRPGPYPAPGRGPGRPWDRGSDPYLPDSFPMDSSQSPPPPQWGATPPGERMYPWFEPSLDRRMSAREALTPPFSESPGAPAKPAG